MLEELLAILRCPLCGTALRLTDATWLDCAEGHRFPVLDGVPVLLDESFSMFSAALISRPGDVARSSRTLLRRLVGRAIPSSSVSVGSAERYATLGRLVAEVAGPKVPKVLVIGGGEAGRGLHALTDAATTVLVETDVYLGPRTAVVCDAHRLPFPDGAFDGVVAQAVLEHVADPWQVAAEIHRVLRPGGLVYAETPFMQQVHEGGFDFTRFSDVGHRRLFRRFEEIDRGVVVGPATALLWSLRYFARALPAHRGPLPGLLDKLILVSCFWLKHLDRILITHPGAVDGASGVYFLGRSAPEPIGDREIVASYDGTIGSVAAGRGHRESA